MKALPSKRCLRARRRSSQRDLDRETAELVRAPGYLHLEPWQRDPIDPGTEHEVSIDIREQWPNGRATCPCGFDTGWLPLWDAEQRAKHHRRLAHKMCVPSSQQGEPVMLNRSLFTSLASREPAELVRTPPVVPLPIQGGQQPIFLVFDQRDLGIELAYERQKELDGTRVRAATRDTMAYFIPRLTPVFAVSEGLIVYARRHGDGHTVIVDHCNGWLSVYHRLEHMFVSPTERERFRETKVAGGDVLGYLAPTAGALVPLRFELWKRDREGVYDPIDPLRFIRRWRYLEWVNDEAEPAPSPAR